MIEKCFDPSTGGFLSIFDRVTFFSDSVSAKSVLTKSVAKPGS